MNWTVGDEHGQINRDGKHVGNIIDSKEADLIVYYANKGWTSTLMFVNDLRSAAHQWGWGQPLPSSDDFRNLAYMGLPNPAKWDVYGLGGNTDGRKDCWPGHAGNGYRCAGQNKVGGGFLRQSGFKDGASAGISHKLNQKYGRWEVRARFGSLLRTATETGNGVHPYHPVLILWPENGEKDFPAGGEYDFLENNVGDRQAQAFIHYPGHKPRVQEVAKGPFLDFSQWHNYAIEWNSNGVYGFVDGVRWFSFDKEGIQKAPRPMHLTIQLDNNYGGDMQEAYFDVEWARVYAP